MTHIARLGALTEELITLLTSTSAKNEPTTFCAHRESALRILRITNYPRTNQFDVSSQLDGLEEKFRVYNNDPLADALSERRNKISKLDTKWTPEILHLLLELSDNPLVKSNVNDLDFLKEPEPDIGPLRWEDLVAEDPLLRDKHVWRNVKFGAESSEDEFEDGNSDLSSPTSNTVLSSVEEEIGRRLEDYIVDIPTKENLLELREAQFWLKDPNVGGIKLETVKKTITELQAIREVLFMLMGFPTSLFDIREKNMNTIDASQKYALKHASADAFYQRIDDLAAQGSALSFLRSWASQPQPIPLLQIFQGAILDRVAKLDTKFSDMQQRYVEPTIDTVVSLLQIQSEVECHARSLLRLSGMVKALDEEPYAHAFRYLEMLYDETCTLQMAGDDELYTFMGTIFFECFQLYLRPIRIFMEEGELSKGDKVFFISKTVGEVEPAALWQSGFRLRRTQAGILHAPKFLQTSASKIFTTGKSVVMLKQLNKFSSMKSSEEKNEPSLDFATVCNSENVQLAPFTELFEVSFAAWVESKHRQASSTLRRILFDSCGLHASLEALSHLYFLADGTSGAAFTNPLFDKLDTLDGSWKDRFTLTELAHSSFSSLRAVNLNYLRTNVLPLHRKYQDLAKCRRTVKTLAIIQLKYHLSWSIQTILTPVTVSSYQRIFTFLLQIRRSSHILSRQRSIVDKLPATCSSDERALYYLVRTRLHWFLQTLYYYLTSLVLHPESLKMHDDLKNAANIDSMIDVHCNYIKSTIEKALLGNKLELIHKTILKILDLAIKLEDAQAANAVASKAAIELQQERMNLSIASLGLHTPQKPRQTFNMKYSRTSRPEDDSSDDEEEELDIDLSILSTGLSEEPEELSYVDQLRKIKADFDRLVRFVASGLRGVARAGGGDSARSWDYLGEMLESGLEYGSGIRARS